jgi:hypothetical protein
MGVVDTRLRMITERLQAARLALREAQDLMAQVQGMVREIENLAELVILDVGRSENR